MKMLQIYRRWLIVVLAVVLFFSGYYIYFSMYNMLPDSMMLCAGDKLNQNIRLCSVSVENKQVMSNNCLNNKSVDCNVSSGDIVFENTGTYTAKYKILGLIDLKSVEINVVDNQTVIAAGYPVGIYVNTDGVMIIGTDCVHGIDQNDYEPAKNILKAGDYVTHVNGEEVSSKEELIDKVNKYGSEDIILNVIRNNASIKVKIKPAKTAASEYKLGIWIRDNTQGVGMLTYIKADGSFGALGHGITDIDTGYLMRIKNGDILHTDIVSIVKGKKGTPGELIGVIDYDSDTKLGSITKNTSNGIFGKIDAIPDYMFNNTVEIGMKEQLTEGGAYIQTCIDGELKQYKINITQIDIKDKGNKGIVFEVVDEQLLNKTGGVLQGMSGSPILKDGKLVGAVTHVLVNDPTRGYGIFIENMLDVAG